MADAVAAGAEELLAPAKVKNAADRTEAAAPDTVPSVAALVVDTNALIQRVRLDGLAQQLYTVPGVMVRRLAALPPLAAARTRSPARAKRSLRSRTTPPRTWSST